MPNKKGKKFRQARLARRLKRQDSLKDRDRSRSCVRQGETQDEVQSETRLTADQIRHEEQQARESAVKPKDENEGHSRHTAHQIEDEEFTARGMEVDRQRHQEGKGHKMGDNSEEVTNKGPLNKEVILLALLGLASCRYTFIGGDRAKDVTIQYSYLNEYGEMIDVEMEADRLGLGWAKEIPTPALRAVAPKPFAPKPITYMRREPMPLPMAPQQFRAIPMVQEVPVVTRYIQVATPVIPPPAPRTVTRYLLADDDDDEVVTYEAVKPVATPMVNPMVALPPPAPKVTLKTTMKNPVIAKPKMLEDGSDEEESDEKK